MQTDRDISLNVHSIESFGTHDGPGIRMVIFLQGCNLNCLYCQNPDTIDKKGRNTKYPIIELVRRAVNMKPYFGKTGGVTVSGGEPLLQIKSLSALFRELKRENIHTNIDTNGTCFSPAVKQLLNNFTDLVMIDIKGTSGSSFQHMTGINRLNVLLQLVNHRETSHKPFWLRYVLIPGYTDAVDQLLWLGKAFGHLSYLKRMEILPYHNLGQHKWEALGKPYLLKQVHKNSPKKLATVHTILTPFFHEKLFIAR